MRSLQEWLEFARRQASAGDLRGAAAAYEQILAQRPDLPDFWNELANLRRATGDLDGALAAYTEALRRRPGYAEAHCNLGALYRERGDLPAAVRSYDLALTIHPTFPEALANLGNALLELGQIDRAIDAYTRALQQRPDFPAAQSGLGDARTRAGRLDEAIACYRAALAEPTIEISLKLADRLARAGRADEAIATCRETIKHWPDDTDVPVFLAQLLADAGDTEAAESELRHLLTRSPDNAHALVTLGNVLKDQGRLDESIACYDKAVALDPHLTVADSNRVYAAFFHPVASPQAILTAQRQWCERQTQPNAPAPHLNNRSPDRRLRVGYVSPDLRNHVVGLNTLPLLREHDRQHVEVYCYSAVALPDAVTQVFQSRADHWRDIGSASDDALAAQVRADGIDILVDLSLHMAGGRLAAFARKPAPVQVTFGGYPAGTGLPQMDYRLTDPYLDPPGEHDDHYVERSVRLPDSFWCYRPVHEQPPPAPLPARANGWITFGCLNDFSKVNDQVLRQWARILAAVPQSRLILRAKNGPHRRRAIDLLGVTADHVRFLPRQSLDDHLRAHDEIDIGLDTFPYNGHTTSLDALYMGVPVVTRVGNLAVSRAGWSQLSNLGLTELAAHDDEQFVQIAVDLAHDLDRLATLRADLRSRMEQSPLMDARRFARNVEAAYRQMWHAWCDRRG